MSAPAPRAVTLIDPFATGHHVSYARWLTQGLLDRGVRVHLVGPEALLHGVRAALTPERAVLLEGVPLDIYTGDLTTYHALPALRRALHDVRFLRAAAQVARRARGDVTHLLYLDRLVLPLLLAWPAFHGLHAQATLHWAAVLTALRVHATRRTAVERPALALLQRLGLHLHVHSGGFAAALGGPRRASAIPYPVDPPPLSGAQQQAWALRRELGLGEQDRLLLAFGGTRHDKGADLAARLLPELPAHVHLLVAGRDEGFGPAALRAGAGPAADRLHLRMTFVPESLAPGLFLAADALLLPYRPAFAGQSGPLTIAASLGRPVVATDVGLLGETVRTYGLGIVVPPEDPTALRDATRTLLARPLAAPSGAFLRDHSLDAFITSVLGAYARAGRRALPVAPAPLGLREASDR